MPNLPVKLRTSKEPVPAKINDELATKFGAEDLKALKTQISERLGSEYGGAARAVMKRQLLDALDKKVKFELPPSLVEAEAKQIAHQLFHDENPDIEGHDHEEVKPSKEHNKLAERRVRLGLLLAELGQKAEVEVSDAEMTPSNHGPIKTVSRTRKRILNLFRKINKCSSNFVPQYLKIKWLIIYLSRRQLPIRRLIKQNYKKLLRR